MKEVMFYEKRKDDIVQCQICPQMCLRKPNQNGFCRVRKNIGGSLYATNYGECSSYGMDPIEKKPLYHFYPGSYIFSIGTVGCNLKCGFCQNWQIAHGNPQTYNVTSEKVLELATEEVEGVKSVGIAYTYNEPFMWYEFVYDTAKLAHEKGLKNVLVTNGYINEKPLKEILPFIDAMNIDVKGFTDNYYKETCAGRLEPVKRTVELAARQCHVEITTLLIPGLNDTPEEIDELASWLGGINKDIPLHISKYFPNYEMDIPPTSMETMEMAWDTAVKKLNYVYLGNVRGLEYSNTYCPQCGNTVIHRDGYRAQITGLEGHKCTKCGKEVNIIE